MKLNQLRYVLEVHRHGNHISAAAEALHTSQPGVSKQIQQLEFELGFDIFERKRNRVVGLTEPGQDVVRIAQRILSDIDTLSKIKDDYATTQKGMLTVATTHTYARYILPTIIEAFIHRYPQVQLNLQQGNPTEICVEVDEGRADMAIGTETMRVFPNLLRFPCFPITRSLIARKGHPILDVEQLTLEEIVKYPIIAYDPHRSGRWKVLDAFERKGLSPRIIFGSVDADVSKTYVELGLGISILATPAVDHAHDVMLGARDASHLFDSSTTYLSIRSNAYLRRFVFDFIEIFSASLTPEVVKAAIQKASV